MSDLRRNPLTGEWVIIAPERGRRPHETGSGDAGQRAGSSITSHPAGRGERPGTGAGTAGWSGRRTRDPGCPFCPGNEGMLSGIIDELSESTGAEPGWQVRVVPNKFPALAEEGGSSPNRGPSLDSGPAHRTGTAHLLEATLPGRGRHEVVIESPRHDDDMASLSDGAAALVLEAYRRRLVAMRALSGVRHVVLFRNHGERAGTSLLHPHSQVVAVPIVPEEVARREREQRAYFAAAKRCLLCDLSQRERVDGRRLVHSTAAFDVLVPFAAEVPFELWLLPRRHQPDFAAVPEAELTGLAVILKRSLAGLKARLGDPDYNYVLHTFAAAPGDPALHWLLQIRPRVVTPAGFEIGSGMSINPSLPEEDAQKLRSGA